MRWLPLGSNSVNLKQKIGRQAGDVVLRLGQGGADLAHGSQIPEANLVVTGRRQRLLADRRHPRRGRRLRHDLSTPQPYLSSKPSACRVASDTTRAIRSSDRERVALRTTNARSAARQAGGDTHQPEGETAAGHNATAPLPGGHSMAYRSPRSRALARSSRDRQEPAHLHRRSTRWVLACRRWSSLPGTSPTPAAPTPRAAPPPWTTRPAAPDTQEDQMASGTGPGVSRAAPIPPPTGSATESCFHRESTPAPEGA
jgi:hypothetical protein